MEVLLVLLQGTGAIDIEIPRDMLNQPGNPEYQYIARPDVSNPDALAAALVQAVNQNAVRSYCDSFNINPRASQ